MWFGCRVLRRAAEMCFLNIPFVCIGQWGRARFVKRGLGDLGCGICSPSEGAAEGKPLQGSWLARVLHLSSPHQSLSSPLLEDGISRREDLIPGGLPSLAVGHFRSFKAGVQAYDGSLPPKNILFFLVFPVGFKVQE